MATPWSGPRMTKADQGSDVRTCAAHRSEPSEMLDSYLVAQRRVVSRAQDHRIASGDALVWQPVQPFSGRQAVAFPLLECAPLRRPWRPASEEPWIDRSDRLQRPPTESLSVNSTSRSCRPPCRPAAQVAGMADRDHIKRPRVVPVVVEVSRGVAVHTQPTQGVGQLSGLDGLVHGVNGALRISLPRVQAGPAHLRGWCALERLLAVAAEPFNHADSAR